MAEITWNILAIDFDMTTKALKRAIKAFESLERTYQELTEFCEAFIKGLQKANEESQNKTNK